MLVVTPSTLDLGLDLAYVWQESRDVPTRILGRTSDDRPFELHYRSGWLRVWLGEAGALRADEEGELVVDQRVGPPLHGALLLEQACRLLGLTIRGRASYLSRRKCELASGERWIIDATGRTQYRDGHIVTTMAGLGAWLRALKQAVPQLVAVTSQPGGEERQADLSPREIDALIYGAIDFAEGATPIGEFLDPCLVLPAAEDAIAWLDGYERMVKRYDRKEVDAYMREADPSRRSQMLRELSAHQAPPAEAALAGDQSEGLRRMPPPIFRAERVVPWCAEFDDPEIRALTEKARTHRPSRIALQERLAHVIDRKPVTKEDLKGFRDKAVAMMREAVATTAGRERERIAKTLRLADALDRAESGSAPKARYRTRRLALLDDPASWLDLGRTQRRGVDLRLAVPRDTAAREAALAADHVPYARERDWFVLDLRIVMSHFGRDAERMLDGHSVKPEPVAEGDELRRRFVSPVSGETLSMVGDDGRVSMTLDLCDPLAATLTERIEETLPKHFTSRIDVVDSGTDEAIRAEEGAFRISRDLVEICRHGTRTYAYLGRDTKERDRDVGWRPVEDGRG